MHSKYYYLSNGSYIILKRKNGNIERIPFEKRSKRNGRHRKYVSYQTDNVLYFMANNSGQWTPIGEIKNNDTISF